MQCQLELNQMKFHLSCRNQKLKIEETKLKK